MNQYPASYLHICVWHIFDLTGIKVNSRGVLAEVLAALGVPTSKFAATCVLVDKLEKVPIDAIQNDLTALGLEQSVVLRLLEVIKSKDIAALEAEIGADSPVSNKSNRKLNGRRETKVAELRLTNCVSLSFDPSLSPIPVVLRLCLNFANSSITPRPMVMKIGLSWMHQSSVGLLIIPALFLKHLTKRGNFVRSVVVEDTISS